MEFNQPERREVSDRRLAPMQCGRAVLMNDELEPVMMFIANTRLTSTLVCSFL
jgi:hypothetical protein